MRQLKIRFGTPEDAEKVNDWIRQNPVNAYDPDIWKAPSIRVLCTYDDSGPVSYLPFQKVFMLESFAPNPTADKSDKAQSLRDFTKACELIASGEGIKEIYFLDGAEGVGEMAEGNGYELMPYKVYRMKL